MKFDRCSCYLCRKMLDGWILPKLAILSARFANIARGGCKARRKSGGPPLVTIRTEQRASRRTEREGCLEASRYKHFQLSKLTDAHALIEPPRLRFADLFVHRFFPTYLCNASKIRKQRNANASPKGSSITSWKCRYKLLK